MDLRGDVTTQIWLREVTGSLLGVTENLLGTSDHRHAGRNLTIIDAAVNAQAPRLYATVMLVSAECGYDRGEVVGRGS